MLAGGAPRAPRPAGKPGFLLRNVPGAQGAPQPICVYDERRPAADARDRPRPDDLSGHAHHRRTVGGPRADRLGQVIATIRKLLETRKLTILMAEQSFFQAIEVASRAYVLSHGLIIKQFDRAHSVSIDEIKSAMMGVG